MARDASSPVHPINPSSALPPPTPAQLLPVLLQPVLVPPNTWTCPQCDITAPSSSPSSSPRVYLCSLGAGMSHPSVLGSTCDPELIPRDLAHGCHMSLQQRREVELDHLLTVPSVALPADLGCGLEDQTSGSLPQRGHSSSELVAQEEEEDGSSVAAGEAEMSSSVAVPPQPRAS